MTTNVERAQRIVGGVIDRLTADKSGVPVATRITQALAEADLLMPDDLIAEKQAHAELRAWLENLHSRVGSVGGGAVTFHKANFLDEITRILEGDDD